MHTSIHIDLVAYIISLICYSSLIVEISVAAVLACAIAGVVAKISAVIAAVLAFILIAESILPSLPCKDGSVTLCPQP